MVLESRRAARLGCRDVTPPVDKDSFKHIPRMDVLRAVAFLAVYCVHFTGSFRDDRVQFNGLWLSYAHFRPDLFFLRPMAFGWLAVPLFFVISGFCVHLSTLRREGNVTVRDFYWRRFVRIYPAYIVAVVLCSLLAPLLTEPKLTTVSFISHVFMVHNLVKPAFFGIDRPMWSLGVEIQFYLLYPLLLHLVRRWGGIERTFVFALGMNIFFQIAFALWRGAGLNPVSPAWSFPLVTWCDWILGAVLAEALVAGRPVFRHEWRWLIGTGALTIFALHFKPLNAQAFLLASAFSAVLIQIYVTRRSTLNLAERFLVPIGLASYSLYLWHEPMIEICDGVAKWAGLDRAAWSHALFDVGATSLLLVPIGWLSYRVLEVGAGRVLRGGARREPLRPAAVAPSA